jgi:hypothetical protein
MAKRSFDEGGSRKETVIHASPASAFFLTMRWLLMLGALLGVCAVMFYSRWEAGRFSVNAVIYGVLIALCMVFVIPSYFFRHLGRRIVVGVDRLQIIDGMGELVTQIPYRNLGRMETFGSPWLLRMLGIGVSNKDRETFWGRGDRGKGRGYDVVIYDVYTESLEEIRERIMIAHGLWRNTYVSFPATVLLASPGAPGAPSNVPPQSAVPQSASAGTGPAVESPAFSSQAAEHQAARPGERATAWARVHTSPEAAEAGPQKTADEVGPKNAERPGERATAWAQAPATSRRSKDDAADRNVGSTPYQQGMDHGTPTLGRVLLTVESAAGTVHNTLLVGGFVFAGFMFLGAAVYGFIPQSSVSVPFMWVPCLTMGLGLVLACSLTLARRLDLHEHGVCLRGLFGARELHYRDLANVEIVPWVITRTVNFVPVSRHSLLHLQFVPWDGTGLKRIEYYAPFHHYDKVTELIRTRWGKCDTGGWPTTGFPGKPLRPHDAP